MFKKHEVRFGGSGGQGQILAGIILAEAAILDGCNVTQTQSYGPEARGGASKAEVLISESLIHFPKIKSPTHMVLMSPEACNKYAGSIRAGGFLLIDSTLVKDVPQNTAGNVYHVSITRIAKEKVGRALFANVVALGALVGLTELVSRDSLEKALTMHIPAGTEELNKKALYEGYKAAEKALDKKRPLQVG